MAMQRLMLTVLRMRRALVLSNILAFVLALHSCRLDRCVAGSDEQECSSGLRYFFHSILVADFTRDKENSLRLP
jgi:hypothetical protein